MNAQHPPHSSLLGTVVNHLSLVYVDLSEQSIQQLAGSLINIMRLDDQQDDHPLRDNFWRESDVWLITYANSIYASDDTPPLKTLKDFVDTKLGEVVTGVHLLPFYPSTSDGGFAVQDYRAIDPDFGDWGDVEAMTERYTVMGDCVVNHCSASHQWFINYQEDRKPGADYFIEASTKDDLSDVVRPRVTALLKDVKKAGETKHVWCTFGHDQVDLDFSNPKVLEEVISLLRFYLDKGIRAFRLDAIAFIWKEIGTSCINLPQTHELIRLMRTLVSAARHDAIIITETNVPNVENLMYFGNANEAHAVYNFALPPLLLYGLMFGTSEPIMKWQSSMPPAQKGTFYFNFIASHDGIGLRPAENLLTRDQVDRMIGVAQMFGGRVSSRTTPEGNSKPYELNIALFDAFLGSAEGVDGYQLQRFICAHAIMFALEGLPGIYIHSFLGTQNNYQGVEDTGEKRAINRYRWNEDELEESLASPRSHHLKTLAALKNLLTIRKSQPAFHPNAMQFTLRVGDKLFGFMRQSMDRKQTIFCLNNMTRTSQDIPLSSLNLTAIQAWRDLIGGESFDDLDAVITLKPYQSIWLANSEQPSH